MTIAHAQINISSNNRKMNCYLTFFLITKFYTTHNVELLFEQSFEIKIWTKNYKNVVNYLVSRFFP